MVVTDSRHRRDGRYIEAVGSYDPMAPSHTNYTVDLEKTDSWISKGAKPSPTVASIIRKARRKAAAAPAGSILPES